MASYLRSTLLLLFGLACLSAFFFVDFLSTHSAYSSSSSGSLALSKDHLYNKIEQLQQRTEDQFAQSQKNLEQIQQLIQLHQDTAAVPASASTANGNQQSNDHVVNLMELSSNSQDPATLPLGGDSAAGAGAGAGSSTDDDADSTNAAANLPTSLEVAKLKHDWQQVAVSNLTQVQELVQTDNFKITFVTVPRAFEGERAMRQTLAILSWMNLPCTTQIILVGDEPGVSEFCQQHSLVNLPDVRKNQYGVPLLSAVIKGAEQISTSDTIVFLNTDIILTPMAVAAARSLSQTFNQFLAVGSRIEVKDVPKPVADARLWYQMVLDHVQKTGVPAPKTWIDIFMFRKGLWTTIPDLAIGRAFVDRWMLNQTYSQPNAHLVDMSNVLNAIHQAHTYKYDPTQYTMNEARQRNDQRNQGWVALPDSKDNMNTVRKWIGLPPQSSPDPSQVSELLRFGSISQVHWRMHPSDHCQYGICYNYSEPICAQSPLPQIVHVDTVEQYQALQLTHEHLAYFASGDLTPEHLELLQSLQQLYVKSSGRCLVLLSSQVGTTFAKKYSVGAPYMVLFNGTGQVVSTRRFVAHWQARTWREWVLWSYSQPMMESLRDKHRGQRAVIIGNGPSLRKMDLSFLKNEITFGLNKVYLGFEDFDFMPTYWLAVNLFVVEQSLPFLHMINSTKFLPTTAAPFVPHIPDANDNGPYWLMPAGYRYNFTTDIRERVVQGCTVTYVAMQIAYHMGFDEVVLIGVDHSFAQKGDPNEAQSFNGPDKNHFVPNYFAGQKWHLADLDTSEEHYKLARDAFSSKGRRILDASLGGKLQIFDKVDYRHHFYGTSAPASASSAGSSASTSISVN